jgi:hypothetical protein
VSAILEHWTEREIQLVRRRLAYHQKCSLRAVSKDAARAWLDEQQRRQNRHYGDGHRYYVGGGTWGRVDETNEKTWPLSVAAPAS